MLQMLPDASFAKHAIHRRRVKGASRDGHRAYLNSVYHYAHHVSKIRYGHKMQAELNKMQEEARAIQAATLDKLIAADMKSAEEGRASLIEHGNHYGLTNEATPPLPVPDAD